MPIPASSLLANLLKTLKRSNLTSVVLIFFFINYSYAEETDNNTNKPQRTFTLPKAMLTDLMQNMVFVEAGSFTMGSDSPQAREREKPAHKVGLDAFYISKYELTQDIFTQIMGWNNSYFPCDKCAVNNVSWFNMQLFIERLNTATGKSFSLPTENQWAYAARGGNQSNNYRYSGSNNIDDVAWYDKNSNNKSHPVGLKKPNELGLYDMTGNLWEFCLDNMNRHAYKNLPEYNSPQAKLKSNSVDNSKKQNKQQKQKAMKVLRGGGYEFSAVENLVFMRDGATNNVRMADIGFRLVLNKK